jgi:hypothetical protein
MKSSPVGLAQIADLDALATAFHAAARGKRGRPEVEAFRDDLHRRLARLRERVMDGEWTPAPMRAFSIRDPKPRLIHAPAFADRVLHHALMAQVGPVLDRSLVFDTYACRIGKGTLAAVRRAADHAARHPWCARIDIRAYFASIDHGVLLGLLDRRFRNRNLMDLFARILAAHHTAPGRGLPIGALTSQHFANAYLGGADRFVLETCKASGLVRYMDDMVWWGPDRAAVRGVLGETTGFLADRLHVTVKSPVHVGRSGHGLGFCGFRVLPGRLRLSRRRRRRYGEIRRAAERAALAGRLDARGLQSAYAGALALTVHAQARGWRRAQLLRVPVDPALEEL